MAPCSRYVLRFPNSIDQQVEEKRALKLLSASPALAAESHHHEPALTTEVEKKSLFLPTPPQSSSAIRFGRRQLSVIPGQIVNDPDAKQRELQDDLRIQIEDNKKRKKEERDLIEGIEIKATLESLSIHKMAVEPETVEVVNHDVVGLFVPPPVLKGKSDPNMGYESRMGNDNGKRQKDDAWRLELQAQIEEKKVRVQNEKKRIAKEDAALENRRYQNGTVNMRNSVRHSNVEPELSKPESIPQTELVIEQPKILTPKPPTTSNPNASRIPRILMSQKKTTAQQDFTRISTTLPITPRILRPVKTPPKQFALKEYPRGKMAGHTHPSPEEPPSAPKFQRTIRNRGFQPKKTDRPPIIPLAGKGYMKRQEKVLPPIARKEIVIEPKTSFLQKSYDIESKRNNEQKELATVHKSSSNPPVDGRRGQAYRKMKLRIADRDSIKSRESDKNPIDPASLRLVQQLMQFKNVLEQEEVRMSVALES
jgi:hypothetical protein